MREIAGRAYHLTRPANLASIRALGMLSASALLQRSAIGERDRHRIERAQRRAALSLDTGAVLSDQLPMPPAALSRCLEAPLEPSDWYSLVNGFAFFWLDVDRVRRLRGASLAEPRVLLTVDAAALVEAHGGLARLTPINSGNARRAAAYRGRGTFVPYDAWCRSGWDGEPRRSSRPRPRGSPPVELAFVDGVADVMRFVRDVRTLAPGENVADA